MVKVTNRDHNRRKQTQLGNNFKYPAVFFVRKLVSKYFKYFVNCKSAKNQHERKQSFELVHFCYHLNLLKFVQHLAYKRVSLDVAASTLYIFLVLYHSRTRADVAKKLSIISFICGHFACN